MERIIEKFREQDQAPFERTVETVPDPVAVAPAIGYSILANVGPVHQMTVQCHVAEDATDEEVNLRIDRVFRVIDRQKAKYEIEALGEELEKHVQTRDQYQKDWEEAKDRGERTLSGLDVQLISLAQQKKTVSKDGQDKFAASGRPGSYKPSGHVETSLRNIETAVESAKKEKERIAAERDVEMSNFAVNVAKFDTAIKTVQEKIDAKKLIYQPSED